MINIQDEVQKIHHQYGMSEVANHKIQLLFEKYAKEYHENEVKKLNILDVRVSVCQCEHPDEVRIRDGDKDFCLACNQQIDR